MNETPIKTPATASYDYKAATEQILQELRRDRDRQIISRRFGFGLSKRQTLEKTVKDYGKPVSLAKLKAKLPSELDSATLEQLMRASKHLAYFDGKWGLVSWPEVNPKSIRDKTYLVLSRHGRPLHFSDIAKHVRG